MSLPVPNLDDRRFQDIVDEAKRMIPRLCPEWTNHNVSDPGVALIELFAWMTEMTLYRLNQVPDRLSTQFLNLMGITPFPARPAQAELTFWLASASADGVVVPAGTEVAAGDGATPIVFTTLEDVRIDQPSLVAALTGNGEDGLRDVLDELRYDRDSVVCFPSEPLQPDDALYLGFGRSLAGQVVELSVTTAASGVGIDPSRPPIVWEAWTGTYWVPCGVHDDDTGGLNRNGTVTLMVPRRHEPLTLGGQRRHWLRVRLVPAAPGQPTYRTSPRIAAVAVACLGGTVRAEHSESIVGEELGRVSGAPGEEFRLNHRPVLPRRDGEHVVVRAPDGRLTRWDEVDDFAASGPEDRHVVWDAAQGIIRFGPAVRAADGSVRQHGAVPAAGSTVAVAAYRTGGGGVGNVGARTLRLLRTSVPFIDRVENLAPASGGVDAESVDNVKERGPLTLRAGQRAVTASDFERLALEATTEVARARCLPAVRPGDPVRLLVVPRCAQAPEELGIDDLVVNDRLYGDLRSYLDARRLIGTSIEVTTPFYVGVSVVASVRPSLGQPSTLVRQRVLDRLYRLLSPVTGGADGAGWPWDTPLTTAALVAAIGELDGVAAVDDLVMFEADLRNGVRLGEAVDVIGLDERTLVLGTRHRVVVR